MNHGRSLRQGTCAILSVAALATMVSVEPVDAAGGKVTDPNGVAPDRFFYYPGTEELGPEEIRMTACGTGMPSARHKHAATCFLVELGNGDKFSFDIGTGSMANVAAYMIPYDMLDKVFLTHLHTDHWGDLATLWAGGWTAGRTGPLKIWGPSGATEEMGTKYAVENFLKAFNWDLQTRNFALSQEPGKIEVTEFDFRGENEVVYQENGVTVRSWPAIHAGDGPVSFALDWSDLKIVIGGDTFPNKWCIDYAKDADVAIHETFLTSDQLVKFYGQSPEQALGVGTQVHTAPPAFGKVMAEIKPRLAIGYHFFNEEGTRFDIYEQVRSVYDGELSLAADNMVWNITADAITERMAVITEEAWSVPGAKEPPKPDPTGLTDPLSDEMKDGAWDVSDVLKPLVDDEVVGRPTMGRPAAFQFRAVRPDDGAAEVTIDLRQTWPHSLVCRAGSERLGNSASWKFQRPDLPASLTSPRGQSTLRTCPQSQARS
ncbi:guanitoxin biosynthesis MBL fold metallo-hydrolase GntH [Tropicimonas sp. TH_r6]|uniref:guanitoxin biosynthesis MBL fold metallo-hydrolase GntH n=1 Tax=Tropicimonas sp. TH_r6 TaxID=3082085 RepID=UPI002952B090|nr:guanitoxin biosynthesis MBL fold metallo-hydrolase GntH [Tropicimonas sp. TH_r6]MDV7144294.1 guanitoxin biosynthesis MBL fold metallo-hydrolase GntH [Tropicimonas sp. TH_r6]